MAVVRERKLALPVAPNRLPEAPLPKAAPMSAPLPCCSRMRPIMPSAVAICSTSTRVNRKFILQLRFVLVRGASTAAGGDDLQEVGRLQRGSPDQSPVDVRLRQQA